MNVINSLQKKIYLFPPKKATPCSSYSNIVADANYGGDDVDDDDNDDYTVDDVVGVKDHDKAK